MECLKFSEDIEIKATHLFLYANLSKDLDLGNTENQGRFDRMVGLGSKLDAASSYIRPEILSMPEEKLWQFVDEEDGLKIYKHSLDDLLRTKAHTLSKDMEELMALSSPVRQVPYNVFDQRFARYLPDLKKKGVEVHARSVFLQGLFFLGPDEINKNFSSAKGEIERLHNISADYGIPLRGVV